MEAQFERQTKVLQGEGRGLGKQREAADGDADAKLARRAKRRGVRGAAILSAENLRGIN